MALSSRPLHRQPRASRVRWGRFMDTDSRPGLRPGGSTVPSYNSKLWPWFQQEDSNRENRALPLNPVRLTGQFSADSFFSATRSRTRPGINPAACTSPRCRPSSGATGHVNRNTGGNALRRKAYYGFTLLRLRWAFLSVSTMLTSLFWSWRFNSPLGPPFLAARCSVSGLLPSV